MRGDYSSSPQHRPSANLSLRVSVCLLVAVFLFAAILIITRSLSTRILVNGKKNGFAGRRSTLAHVALWSWYTTSTDTPPSTLQHNDHYSEAVLHHHPDILSQCPPSHRPLIFSRDRGHHSAVPAYPQPDSSSRFLDRNGRTRPQSPADRSRQGCRPA